jgi:hypothetical protein
LKTAGGAAIMSWMENITQEPWPVGRLVRKVKSSPDEVHAAGSIGEIVDHWGWAPLPGTTHMVFGYVVRWEGEEHPFLCFNDGRFALMEAN